MTLLFEKEVNVVFDGRNVSIRIPVPLVELVGRENLKKFKIYFRLKGKTKEIFAYWSSDGKIPKFFQLK